MKIAIINSKEDKAGKNIRKHLLLELDSPDVSGDFYIEYNRHDLFFVETKGRLIYEESLDERVGSDLIIFISRHTSKNPVPALTVHVTGNYSEALLGGEKGELSRAAPLFMHSVLIEMNKRAPEGFKVSYEVTHHGPTDLKTPSCFVEIGSTEEEWTNDDAGRAVARSVLESLRSCPSCAIKLAGFGGNHYAARETEIALCSSGAFGHIAHTREVKNLDSRLVKLMVEMSSADACYIDKKALNKNDVRRIEKILEGEGIPYLSENEIKDMGSISWKEYLKLKDFSQSISPGCRIHLKGLLEGKNLVFVEINGDLLEAALSFDEKYVIEGVENMNSAYLTSKTGRMLPIFITYEENRLQTINDLISLCVKTLHKDKNTAVIDDHMVIRKIRFDPAKAAELGVPKGPFFGKLAAGFDVMAEDRLITPAMVSKCSEKVIHIPGLEKYL
ncbi:D-aminoacyl-tRNA deacylase [Methanomicrobium sp. W14]|uniref:D-aminoacyl-tRNA deacylase n=1 Tax=Methanomicrobium sp. W14 TaxID=2817839 RepID=UPI001AE1F9C1|nr:D-aminoacyl-tRNA deacylase [Methanomicrobium sp. W14]MBP2133041.1 D-aminoacyl-tRNA deacylase [Methanomicrobium sp. W14]